MRIYKSTVYLKSAHIPCLNEDNYIRIGIIEAEYYQ